MTDENEARLGGGRPTINDIARLAGVSKKTVSRVVNDSPSVKPATRAVVEAVIARTGYAPDPHARGLAFGRAFLVGFAYDRRAAAFAMECQAGLLSGLAGSGLELIVRAVDGWTAAAVDDLVAFAGRQRLLGMTAAGAVDAPADWLVISGEDAMEGGRRAAEALLARRSR